MQQEDKNDNDDNGSKSAKESEGSDNAAAAEQPVAEAAKGQPTNTASSTSTSTTAVAAPGEPAPTPNPANPMDTSSLFIETKDGKAIIDADGSPLTIFDCTVKSFGLAILKPDIVFFGQDLPDHFYGNSPTLLACTALPPALTLLICI
jgi:NAD-dependent SIR2 family protein deacetylase